MTLVEILTALFVLSIGLAGVLSITIRSSQMGAFAADRNNASVITPEAIKDIERMLLVDASTAAQLPNGSSHLGELMDTVDISSPNPSLNPFYNFAFSAVDAGRVQRFFPLNSLGYKYNAAAWTAGASYNKNDVVTLNDKFYYSLVQQNTTQPPGPTTNPVWVLIPGNLAFWPMNPWLSRVMGQFPNAGPEPCLNNAGVAYRGLFKLEPHPEWVPDPSIRGSGREIPDSAFAGVYVLTITMYRDLEPGKPTTDQTKKLQQVSDPVVVFLRDKKVR